jgi:threonyl-tRNA synthetase
VSTRPEKSIGTTEQWERAERALMDAAEASGYAYEVDEGEGAFYGPKIDIHARDAIGREWQLTTIQVDFNLPGRFDLSYVGDDGQKHEPFMVHRALFGSIERFFAVLLESTNGAFPFWLAPEQVRVVPVAEDFADHAEVVAQTCRAAGLRAEVDTTDDTLGARIRSAQTSKVPVTLVVGAEELAARTVAVRRYGGDQRKGVPLGALIDELVAESAAGRRGEIAPG